MQLDSLDEIDCKALIENIQNDYIKDTDIDDLISNSTVNDSYINSDEEYLDDASQQAACLNTDKY